MPNPIPEELEPQQPQGGEPTPETGLTDEEVAELKRRAEVSSQNFERAKKAEEEAKALREQLRTLQEQPSGFVLDEDFSDEGKKLKDEIGSVNQKLSSLERRLELASLYEDDVLRENRTEFEEFLRDPENTSLPLSKAATLFKADKGLLGGEPRKGLERHSGGNRTPAAPGISPEDVKRLRETNFKLYQKKIASGEIRTEDLG